MRTQLPYQPKTVHADRFYQYWLYNYIVSRTGAALFWPMCHDQATT